ncbi:cob(I)yrinic acid a,c-diamide adenosyltransferase [Alicyclobacillus cycloheptanicus]|uniref:Corrinoid adenosyltransferase n=1 Tax=Alicyclobacillus cycloheptanicus TaxID=1457 RepID=A0ABT9XD49_9BACL|nr:cob(I)yrinic acid a,c-diamide adenosyltransferase [Alicyclobacillus cycloheptanicus]MDQ0188203.1 cob(I)alamin adenosyltransferase [Alicyclobacillus cycloheptanicus]WDM00934.1 cob(I)yrinic acid a,c-diamide adenosyltransferase [Alicyclobacillus cycloheptanicus]
MKIYTRSGDGGQTSLVYGRRIDKDALRVRAYGTVDEANSVLGVALAALPAAAPMEDVRAIGWRIQRDLFDVGRDLATPEDRQTESHITQTDIQELERMIDALWAQVPPLHQFVLPGGQVGAAMLHHARTVIRRAEREVVALGRVEPVPPLLQKYLNRLSDLLFAMARVVNARTGTDEPTVDFQAEKVRLFPEAAESNQPAESNPSSHAALSEEEQHG